jgi:DNA ligase (NAD+)
VDQLIPLERLGEKSALNIINSIRSSAGVPYPRVLYALGIRHVGETMAKTVSKTFGSVDELMQADSDTLTSVREIGPKIAASIISFFRDEDNIRIIQRLKSYGLKLNREEDSAPATAGGKLTGKTILISGVFKEHTREEYKEIIEKNGGKNATSLSSNTSFLLAGENMGPSKREKAESLGIPLISESDFLKLIHED